ncbi:NDP-hexose 2,3-dehydratase family protein [Streptomyces sp. NPDC003032]
MSQLAKETALRSRENAGLSARLARSAATTEGSWLTTGEFADWLAARAGAHRFRVERIPFDALDGWSFQDGTGNLVHRSGRFFSVEGLHVTIDDGPHREWHQPIVHQPEVGVLGILAKEFDGVLHFLMQAKMEPGNRNLLQLSPTVQATRSNYTKVHQGADVKYIEYFNGEEPSQVIVDVLQSEHGSWFYRKSNRNMIVEAFDEVPLDDDFCWLTLRQIGELLARENVVNMDTRTVLACAPFGGPARRDRADDSFRAALLRSSDPATGALHSDTELLSWFTGRRSHYDTRAERVPLTDLPGWHRTADAIEHHQGRYFRVVAVRVEAGGREVPGWTQPLIEPVGQGVAAFLVRVLDGVLHVLVQAKPEGGFLGTVELAPTVQCTSGNHDEAPLFLDEVLAAVPGRIRYDTVHSEEGGRFLHAETRYLVVEAEEPTEPGGGAPSWHVPDDYAWVTVGQLTSLVRHGHYVNVQARTLLACLNSLGYGSDDVDG